MKTKWGSCNRETGHIWFNVELAKKHPDCLEYIVVHEMTHLLERNHGERFTKLMDEYMPDWRSRRTTSTSRRSRMKSGITELSAWAVTMKFESLTPQNEIAINAAGARYTPGIDPTAPNIEIDHLVDAVNALGVSDGYRNKVSDLISELDEALRTTRGTVDSVFNRRRVTPAVVRDDLDRLRSIKRPGLIRKQVLILRRRIKLVRGALERESEHIFSERHS